ncbi:MAG: hypothetical protein ACI8UO_003922, partial [Verrucomicrobiales bacterium]
MRNAEWLPERRKDVRFRQTGFRDIRKSPCGTRIDPGRFLSANPPPLVVIESLIKAATKSAQRWRGLRSGGFQPPRDLAQRP